MTINDDARIVLILGSAPDAVMCRNWRKPANLEIVAINNAWRIREDWDYLIAPDDFPPERGPTAIAAHQTRVTSQAYVPANNRFGGTFYAGGTMAFTAGYWALATLRPRVLAYLGCDMIYPASANTHFYGAGRPDPLRADPSLRSLEAKAARLQRHASQQGCRCVRLSFGESRLVFPSVRFDDLMSLPPLRARAPDPRFDAAKTREARLGYFETSGRYWDVADAFDIAEIDALDMQWLEMRDD